MDAKNIAMMVFTGLVVVAVITFIVLTFYGKSSEGFECWCRGDDGSLKTGTIGAGGVKLPTGPSATETGAFNAGWGVTAAMFPDTGARVIWNAANSIVGAPPNLTTPIVFTKVYNNPMTTATPVKMMFLVDDTADIILNGAAVTSVTACCTVSTINMTLAPGQNVLSVSAKNLGTVQNPAGLLLSVMDMNNNVLFHTDSSWMVTSQ